jgi:hypothetical protein
VADVNTLPGVFEQVGLVSGIRWRILRNSLRRKNNRWDLVGMIFAGVFSGMLVVGLSVLFFIGGYAFLAKGHPEWFALLFWAIFLWWQIFPIFVAGFGSTFEFTTLLRFPMSLRAFYLLGVGYGLADFASLSSIFWILSMLVGAAFAKPSAMPILLLVSVLFVLVNVTLERLTSSILEKLLSKRRSREIFLTVFVLAMVSLNLLNPLMQKYGSEAKSYFLKILPYIVWLPGSLSGNAVQASMHGNYRAFLLAFSGLLCWFVVLTLLLWRRFTAQFAGEETSESAAPAPVRKKTRRESAIVSDKPGFLPPQVSAVYAKEFRYMTRNGFTFMSLVIPPVMVLFFTMQFSNLLSHNPNYRPWLHLFYPGMMAYMILILLSPAYNSFAFEGKGIQTYFMSPADFREIFLGKNLFVLTLVAIELLLVLSMLTWRIGWPGAPLFVSTIGAAIFAVVGQLTIANWSSLSFPKKMELGKMKGQRNSGVAIWTAFGVQIALSGICALILAAGVWTRNLWLPAITFTGLTVVVSAGYGASLSALNDLAQRKKELLIETLCR